MSVNEQLTFSFLKSRAILEDAFTSAIRSTMNETRFEQGLGIGIPKSRTLRTCNQHTRKQWVQKSDIGTRANNWANCQAEPVSLWFTDLRGISYSMVQTNGTSC